MRGGSRIGTVVVGLAVVAWLGASSTVPAPAEAPTGAAASDAAALKTQCVRFLQAFFPASGDSIVVDQATALPQEGLVRVAGHLGGLRNPVTGCYERHFSALVDLRNGFVGSLYCSDPGLGSAVVGDGRSVEGSASDFARHHFAQWSAQTKLVAQFHKESGASLFRWSNVLPSGAWLGGWCCVMVDCNRGRVTAFSQEKALREVDEGAVRIPRGDARRVALDTAGAGLPPNTAVEAKGELLVLSCRWAPDCGPVWVVSVAVAGKNGVTTHVVRDVVVDAVAGTAIRGPMAGPPTGAESR